MIIHWFYGPDKSLKLTTDGCPPRVGELTVVMDIEGISLVKRRLYVERVDRLIYVKKIYQGRPDDQVTETQYHCHVTLSENRPSKLDTLSYAEEGTLTKGT